MRISKVYLLLISMFALGGQAFAGSGGPDAYGYVWKDSNEPTGPSFGWNDIRSWPGAVAVTGLGDDNAVGQFNIGWNFHFYWSDYNKVKVGSNGWISFNNVGNIASCFPAVPQAGGSGDNLVVPYMSDLTFASNSPSNPNIGTIHYWSNSVDSFVIQYTNVPWWQQGTPDWKGSNTFQIVLSGQDSSITFYYLDTDESNLAVSAGCASSFEIGIENLTGNVGLNVASGTNSAVPPDSFAVKFYYPAVVTFQVPDASPLWAANNENAGQFVYTTVPTDLSANIGNVGNAAITNSISVAGKVKVHPAQTVIYNQTTSLATGLGAGADSTVTFAPQLTLTNPGQYYYEVQTTNGQDINPSNNLTTVELSAVSNTGGSVILSYCTGGAPDGSISWSGGGIDDGVAIKIVPPGYPLVIDSVSVFTVGDGNLGTPMASGFQIQIYGSDVNGNVDLNNLLQVEDVAALDVLEEAWNRLPLDSSVTISSGAVFVAWFQGGTGIGIGTEAFGPISRRTYEVLSGAWAPYRSNVSEEMLIQVSGSLPVGIDDQDLPGNATFRCFPNPSNGLVTIDYQVKDISDVSFTLTSLTGQVVWNKTHAAVAPGNFAFQMDGTNLSKGVYMLTMNNQGQTVTKKVVLY